MLLLDGYLFSHWNTTFTKSEKWITFLPLFGVREGDSLPDLVGEGMEMEDSGGYGL